MHALLITYTSLATPEEVREPYTQYAQALASGQAAGFISKTWLHNGDTHGGFHLFRDRETADRYLAEMFEPAVATNPAFSNLRVEHFQVNEELSRLTSHIGAAAGSVA